MTDQQPQLEDWERDALDAARAARTPTTPASETIAWGDPPDRTDPATPSEHWANIAHELRAHPGRWAKVDTRRTSNLVTYIRHGRYAAFRPANTFEATARSVGKDETGTPRFDVYAKYVGNEAA